MNEILKAQLLLNACKAPSAAWEMLKSGGAPERLWMEGESFWRQLGLRPSSAVRLGELLAEGDWPEREMERVHAFGARFVPLDDPGYPVRLKDLPSPPTGLYVKGKLDSLKPCLALVGTRKCSHYGRVVADAIGRMAAQAGHQVISGGAKGIDGAGHRGCLAEKGTTLAVLGTGVDRVYPAEHQPLFHEIAATGALISEYPMGTGGDPWRFPERNRLIVGLCNRLVVVESPEDGGAMITARLALDMGREIWCVPGRITEAIARGTNALIRDGANPLIDVDDFIGKISGKYGQLLLDLGEKAPDLQISDLQLSEKEKTLLELLRRKGGRTLDDLLAESGLGFVEVQACLANLCASNLAYSSGPGRFSAGI
ncbi:MAG: DNA-processing protein DprA [Synergistaceae bacterium]|jgi:DNA processing protein|nr:DNA-processing protein DprA [Synergistaceae bacterium]